MTTNDIKLLCNEKENNILTSNLDNIQKQKNVQKIEIIRDNIKEENWMFKISVNELLNILYFLGIPKSELKEKYYQLISLDNYKNHETLKIIN